MNNVQRRLKLKTSLMKYLLFALILLTFSCSNKEKEQAEGEDDIEWKEMDDFHAIMADVYHPLKDSGNLEPIRNEANTLSAEATKWAQSRLPSKVNDEETKKMLAQLEDGCQQLNQLVKDKASDEEISTKLTSLHETFHHITERWHSAGKEEGAEEHHEHH